MGMGKLYRSSDEKVIAGVCAGLAHALDLNMTGLRGVVAVVALIYLAELMRDNGGVMIDCQLETPHLKSMGGRYISYDEYMGFVRME